MTSRKLAVRPCFALRVFAATILMIGSTARSDDDSAIPLKASLAAEFESRGLAPRAQHSRNTCSLFAITGLANFEWSRSSEQPVPPLSEEYLVWAANEATGLQGDQAMFYEAVHGLNQLGICPSERMPYQRAEDLERAPDQEARAAAAALGGRWRVHWIRRWNVRRPLEDDELKRIKMAIADGHPVACGLRWPRSGKDVSLIEVPPPSDVFDGHSIVLCGYRDDQDSPGGGILEFRNSMGSRWGRQGIGEMSYAYLLAYANDALWLEFGPEHSAVPDVRLEGESLSVTSLRDCADSVQEMKPWGAGLWSGGSQRFVSCRREGELELAIEIPRAARWRLELLATVAPDYGTVRVSLDGDPMAEPIDLYSGRVSPSGSILLGTVDLNSGTHSLKVSSVGRNRASRGFAFGIDAVDLYEVEDDATESQSPSSP